MNTRLAYLDLELPTTDERLLDNYFRALCHDVIAKIDVIGRTSDENKLIVRVTATYFELTLVAYEYAGIVTREIDIDELIMEIVEQEDGA